MDIDYSSVVLPQPLRFVIEQVEDDPEYWHVVDRRTDQIIEICNNRYEAEETINTLNMGEE